MDRRLSVSPRATASAPAPTTPRPPSTQLSPFKSDLGRGSELPNLYWTAVPSVQLRNYHSNHVGLPPTQDIIVSEPSTYRYVRQQTPLWQELHAGRLTTGRLNAALGFQEPKAARAVGAYLSPGAIVSVYQDLTLPSWSPSTTSSDEGGDVQRNEAARTRLYDSKLPLSSLPPGGVWDTDSGDAGEATKRRVCEQVAIQGVVPCRLHWGNVQEASALQALGQVFPSSIIEEVGMLHVDTLTLPSSWGCDPSELPPLGASPDALIRHSLPITALQIQQARAELMAGDGASAATTTPGPGSGGGDGALRQGAAAAARRLLLAALASLELGPAPAALAPAAPAGGTASTLAAGPSAAPAAAAAPTGAANRNSSSGGLLSLVHTNDQSVEFLAGLILHPTTSSTGRNHQHLGPTSDSGGGGSQQHQGSHSGTGALYSSSSSSSGSSSTGGAADQQGLNTGEAYVDGQGTAWVPWREVVEVKNHCPFTIKEQRKARHGKVMLKYALREFGPLQQVRASWLPQLQWHCLAAGTQSALLVSRSPSKGISVFRVNRDDDFLMLALRLVRHVHIAYSGRGLLPPLDIMQSPDLRPQHQAAIMATRQLASQSALLVSRSGHHQGDSQHIQIAPGADKNALWLVRNK